MKYLQDYIEAAQTEALNAAGAFFAFSNEQFDAKKKEGTKYYRMGAGLICPKDTADQLVENLYNIALEGIKKDMEENGKAAIIRRELFNHECQISMDYSDCVRKLEDYPITEEEIKKAFPAFMQECVDNDYF